MNPSTRAIIHILAQVIGQPVILTQVPVPYNLVVAVIWAGIGAAIAFLDQSLSKTS